MQRQLEFEPIPAPGWRGSDRELILAGDEKTVIPLRSERLGNHCQWPNGSEGLCSDRLRQRPALAFPGLTRANGGEFRQNPAIASSRATCTAILVVGLRRIL